MKYPSSRQVSGCLTVAFSVAALVLSINSCHLARLAGESRERANQAMQRLYDLQRAAIEREAAKRGCATRAADENGNSVSQWKEGEDHERRPQ